MSRGYPTPAQSVITYDLPGRTGIGYDTAYGEEQIKDGVARCLMTHSAAKNVKGELASKHFQQTGGRW